jgi:DNA-binding CsgD family transcriptional regulator
MSDPNGGSALLQPRRRNLPATLTAREVDCMRRHAQGSTYEEIAADLGISAATVGNHLRHLRMKLRCTNSVQAAVKLAKAGLL